MKLKKWAILFATGLILVGGEMVIRFGTGRFRPGAPLNWVELIGFIILVAVFIKVALMIPEPLQEIGLKLKRYHSSHILSYGERSVRCISCEGTGEQLYRECPQAVDLNKLKLILESE